MSTLSPSAPPAQTPDAGTDWRVAIPESRRRALRVWLAAGAGLTFLILVVGGITRLTQSGLSIVDWDPILGVVPPLNEADWREAFARYQQFPEYQKLRQGMTLDEFRSIYFWEWLHRLLARAIGLVFLIPFALFWARGYFNPQIRRRVLVLFALGALQGAMGWFMVMSGLVDDPYVSHYRLAAHLSIALAILGYCLWLHRDLSVPHDRSRSAGEAAGSGVYLLGGLLLAQILWGAFVAGLDAGAIFNTFPEMAGRLVPPGAFSMEPALRNLVENPATVQWVHRILGTVLLLAAAAVFLRTRRAAPTSRSRGFAGVFLGLVIIQYGLGIATLLLHVPVALGVLHQGTAVCILGVWVGWAHSE